MSGTRVVVMGDRGRLVVRLVTADIDWGSDDRVRQVR
jgi:hypothetical protein